MSTYVSPTWSNGGEPAISAENLQALTDCVEASQTMQFNATLTAAGWTGTSAPYSQTITVNGINADYNYTWGGQGLSPTQYNAAVGAGLQVYVYAANSVTFQAMVAKPSVDIPIVIQR